MRQPIKVLTVLFSLAFVAATDLVAQVSGGPTCETVYLESTRNLSFMRKDASTLNAVFEHVCRQDGSVNDLRFKGGAGFPIEGVPVEFTGAASSLRQKTENFCRLYKDAYLESTKIVSNKSTVVVEALNAFNQCKLIEAQSNVIVTHSFANPDAVAIKFQIQEHDFNSQDTGCQGHEHAM